MRGAPEGMKLRDAPELYNHMELILQTKINLFEFAGRESDSPEASVHDLGKLFDWAGLTQGAIQHGEDVLDTRRRILDGLIFETGGGGEHGVPF